jgi:hypothetical protein
MIPDRRAAKKSDDALSADTMTKNVGSILRVVDAIGANPNQVE